jgi:hypothetical protein
VDILANGAKDREAIRQSTVKSPRLCERPQSGLSRRGCLPFAHVPQLTADFVHLLLNLAHIVAQFTDDWSHFGGQRSDRAAG